MNEKMLPISKNDIFTFSCSKDISCFNECCRDLNQFLTPYDIIRMKTALNISSSDFFLKYAMLHEGPESGLPIATIRTDASNGYQCPFVTNDGCSIYTDRPASCRTYPIARAIVKSRDAKGDGAVVEHFALLKEAHCRGFCRKKIQTVSEWIKEQNVEEYNVMNDLMMEIISLKNRLIPGALDEKSKKIFCTALYDLDNFRSEIFKNNILKEKNISGERLEILKTDDKALLIFGMDWVKYCLFGIPLKK